MNSFPGGPDAIDEIERTARDWVFSPQLRDLVAISQDHIPSTGTRGALAWLDDFSAREWDFRAGRERSAMRLRDYPPEVAATITRSLRGLGLTGRSTPARDHYDRLLILGGGAPACFARPAFAAGLLTGGLRIGGGLRVGGVAALGSDRPLRETERAFLTDAGATGDTEADAIEAGARAAFGPNTTTTTTAGTATTAGATSANGAAGDGGADVGGAADSGAAGGGAAGGGGVLVVCARRGAVGTRANTADTYDAWRAADPGEHRTVLVVTTDIYVPFQHFDAVRKIGLAGCSVETIGVPAGFELPGGHRVRFTLSHYLQEVRSAIRSLRRLLAAIDGDRTIADSR